MSKEPVDLSLSWKKVAQDICNPLKRQDGLPWFPLLILSKIGDKPYQWYFEACHDLQHRNWPNLITWHWDDFQLKQDYPKQFQDLLLRMDEKSFQKRLQNELDHLKNLGLAQLDPKLYQRLTSLSQKDVRDHFLEWFGQSLIPFNLFPEDKQVQSFQKTFSERQRGRQEEEEEEHDFYVLDPRNGQIIFRKADEKTKEIAPPVYHLDLHSFGNATYEFPNKEEALKARQYLVNLYTLERDRLAEQMRKNTCLQIYPKKQQQQQQQQGCDPLEIGKLLGQGAFATVYRPPLDSACHNFCAKNGKKCVVRSSRSSDKDHDMIYELLAKNKISPQLHARWLCSSGGLELMDEIKGKPLYDWLREIKYDVENPRFLAFSQKLLDKIKRMHQLGIVHGDLGRHLGNILVDSDDDEPWLIDLEFSHDEADNQEKQREVRNLFHRMNLPEGQWEEEWIQYIKSLDPPPSNRSRKRKIDKRI